MALELIREAGDVWLGSASDEPHVVCALLAAIEARDHGTQAHGDRVMTYATEIAERLSLSPDRIERLRIAAELHDVGKFVVPEEILGKRGGLTEEEFKQVKRHCAAGERILLAAGLPDIACWVRSHHEHWDGRGYPDGLRRRNIPLESRIIVGADSLDAMTTHRSYRDALSVVDARAEIERCAGKHFDPEVAAAMVAMLDVGRVQNDAGCAETRRASGRPATR